MKFFLFLLAMVGVAIAGPLALEGRQFVDGITVNEFTTGGCRDVIFLFARGTGEFGNMGMVVGPPLNAALKRQLGSDKVATEGIDYPAAFSTNILPGGADPVGISKMKSLIAKANQECPTSKIVVGGYSQGAAIVHRAVEGQSDAVKAQIAAAITFGDSQNVRDRGQIPNFDTSKTKVICNFGDLVCAGMLTITAPHLSYGSRVSEGVSFIAQKLGSA